MGEPAGKGPQRWPESGEWWAPCTPSGVPAGLHAASSLGSEHTVLSVLFPLAVVAAGER